MSYEELYKKYPHIVLGSIQQTPKGKVILCSKDDKIVSHGLVCIIKCATDGAVAACRKTRMINIQDAKQVKQCKTCIKYNHNLRRRLKRSNEY
jgi:hypothetical protein